MAELTLKQLTDALHDRGESDLAALRFTTRYEPAAGRGAKVSPPTYPTPQGEPPYVLESRYLDGDEDGEPVRTVLLDSIAAQANAVEQALLDAVDDGEIPLPLLEVRTTVHDRKVRLTTLDMPHRCSDAYLRDSVSEDGERFDKTEIGQGLRRATLRDATAVYRCCPTALVYGTWDSHRGRPELSFKAPRAYVSEIFGIGPQEGFRVGSRLDPLGMLGGTVKKGEEPTDWTLLEIEGEQTQEEVEDAPSARSSERERLSEVGHGNVAPQVEIGGVAVDYARREASITMAGLRRLRFPVDGERNSDRDASGRAVLAALALLGDRLAFGRPDISLRSGCDLVVLEDRTELVLRGGVAEPIEVDTDQARDLFATAIAQAESQGLDWLDEPVTFTPRSNLQKALEQNIPEV